MKRSTCLTLALVMLVFASSLGAAGDFGRMRDFNIREEADSLDFHARLEACFKIGELEISAVFGHMDEPADGVMFSARARSPINPSNGPSNAMPWKKATGGV